MQTLKLNYSTDYLIYDLILDFLMVIVLISGYVEHIEMWRMLGVMTLALTFCLYGNSVYQGLSESRRVVLSGLCLVLVMTLCALFTVSDTYIVQNLKGLFYAFCPAASYIILTGEGLDRLSDYLRKRLPLLNAVYVVHLYILSRQIQGTGFMIKASWLAKNSYYKDQCSGIFGFNSTHSCALFSVFMLFLNLNYLTEIKGRYRRLLFITYTLAAEAVMLYCAAFSDNIALFVLTPFFVVLYYYLSGKELGILSFVRKHIKQIAVFLIIIVLIGLALLSVPAVTKTAETVYGRVYRVLYFNDTGVKGSNERLAILVDALSQPFGWLFGYGLGEQPWKGLDLLGYRHFGISSIGSTTYLCGLWAFAALMAFYISLSTYAAERSASLAAYRLKIRAVSFLSLFMLTVYTTLFIEIRKLLLFLMIMAVMQLRIQPGPLQTDVPTEQTEAGR